MSDSNKTPFWYDSPSILIKKDKLTMFFPTKDMSPYEKMNAITRLSIYLAILLFIFNQNINNLFIPIITALLLIVIYKGNKEKLDILYGNKEFLSESEEGETALQQEEYGKDQLFDDDDPKSKYKTLQDVVSEREKGVTNIQEVCVKPTQNNPFMNVLLTDYIKDPQRGPACPSYNNPAVKKEIEKDFSYNLYQGADDVYNKRNSQREFYTNPGTTIPNDRNTLLKWAYHLPPTCKQGAGTGCWRLVYQQYKRNPLPINPI